MAQTTAGLPTGIRAFNKATTLVGGGEVTAILVRAGDGGQLSLESVDGVNGGNTTTIRAYAILADGRTSQLYEAEVASGANFDEVVKGGVYGTVDEPPTKTSLAGAVALGQSGIAGFKITVAAATIITVSIGATFDRRVDGPI